MSQQGPIAGSEDRYSQIVRSDLVRPRYSPGLILEDSDLTAAVEYTRALNRLLLRSLVGSGIVAGLEVGVERDDAGLHILVAAGLALDGWGDPIHLVSQAAIALDPRDGVLPERGGAPPTRRNLWVVLSGGEERSEKRELVPDGDDFDGLVQTTRIRATAKVSVLFERPVGICAYDPAAPDFAGKDPVDYYDELAARHLGPQPEGADSPKPDGGQLLRPTDAGRSVLLAWVHWFEPQKAWAAIHHGERRFVRPAIGLDPIQDALPGKSVETAAASRSAKPVPESGKST